MNNQDQVLNAQTYVLKVGIHCEGCERKVKKILRQIDGVYKLDVGMGKVTVLGNVDPQILIQKLVKKGKRAELLIDPKSDNKDLQNGNDNGGGNKKGKNVQIDNNNGGGKMKAKNGNNNGNGRNKPNRRGEGKNETDKEADTINKRNGNEPMNKHKDKKDNGNNGGGNLGVDGNGMANGEMQYQGNSIHGYNYGYSQNMDQMTYMVPAQVLNRTLAGGGYYHMGGYMCPCYYQAQQHMMGNESFQPLMHMPYGYPYPYSYSYPYPSSSNKHEVNVPSCNVM
ncbi:heavy metal-associated isoprenylated plant protein 36-like [Impatiens glandulifera]|uniref:heavy metal-associated isoprenylated plant protein 36-like n=1 Tax=Impatiens glandulifera TaxID=253017 RepID=UPI001FB13A84|nr:heavy metal-associated isoprenylated plant protein 36-like [Impatiens glandulifera]